MKIRSWKRCGALAALFVVLLSSSSAIAQESASTRTGSFFGELKELMRSPGLTDFVQSKLGAAPGNMRPLRSFPSPQQQGFFEPARRDRYNPAPIPSYTPAPGSSYAGNIQNDRRDFGGSPSPTAFRALVPAETRLLARYDIAVLIDRSGSMSTQDCPSPYAPGMSVSRWQWCRDQTAYLARETRNLSKSITVVPFANKAQRFEGSTPADIHGIFAATAPGGATNLAAALKGELNRYFEAREAGIRVRPLMIAVISDGVPSSKSAVRKAITEATRRMTSPDEIRISFFQVGGDYEGTRFLHELDRELVNDGAATDIVRTSDFSQLMYTGLPAALAGSLADRRY